MLKSDAAALVPVDRLCGCLSIKLDGVKHYACETVPVIQSAGIVANVSQLVVQQLAQQVHDPAEVHKSTTPHSCNIENEVASSTPIEPALVLAHKTCTTTCNR